jgi:hypothetical protein
VTKDQQYQTFDTKETGKASWVRLLINTKALDAQETCSLCVKDISTAQEKRLACGHIYHINCFNKWAKPTCAVCRAPTR